jgi:hypothetical protein
VHATIKASDMQPRIPTAVADIVALLSDLVDALWPGNAGVRRANGVCRKAPSIGRLPELGEP